MSVTICWSISQSQGCPLSIRHHSQPNRRGGDRNGKIAGISYLVLRWVLCHQQTRLRPGTTGWCRFAGRDGGHQTPPDRDGRIDPSQSRSRQRCRDGVTCTRNTGLGSGLRGAGRDAGGRVVHVTRGVRFARLDSGFRVHVAAGAHELGLSQVSTCSTRIGIEMRLSRRSMPLA